MIIRYRYGEEGERDLDQLLAALRIEIVPFTEQQATIAWVGHRRYGKGLHPVSLNYGDCFAYALAIDSGEPLLFEGNDFSRTDVAAAAY